ncbi:MAG: SurA N-terminal domain-containing protein [Planctomycetota bacterium]|nr:SurA N-terminal domain-containing protein [Planctomycetota bacterium]
MSTGFFKRNERVVMTLLLLFIAPTFAATGLISWYARDASATASYEINGEDVTRTDFDEKRRELSKTLWLNNVRRFGWWGARADRYRQATVDDVLKQLVFEDEIIRRGIEPSDQSKDQAVRDAILDVSTWYTVMQNARWVGTYQERTPEFNSIRPTARLEQSTYGAALKDPLFQIMMSKKEFENTVILSLRVQELVSAVTQAAVVSEKEAFEEFSTQNERRVLELIQVPHDSYLEEASDLVTPDDVEATYQDDPEKFVLENRLGIEVARIDRARLQAVVEYEPTVEEVETRYEADKDTLWRVRRPEGYVPPEDAVPEDDYRPLAEIIESVIRVLSREHAQKEEARILQDALDQLRALKDLDEEVPLEQVFPEGIDYVEVRIVEPFIQREVYELEDDIKNPAAFATLFIQERTAPGSVKPGDLCNTIAANGQGNFIFRVVEMLPKRTMTFDEAIVDALEATELAKAKELMSEAIEQLLERVHSGVESLEEVALENNFTIHEMDPVSRSQSFNLKIDNRILLARTEVIAEAFDILEEGAVVGPVTNATDKSGYIVRLKSIETPDMELFEALRASTETRLLNAKRQALLDAFEANLMAAADIRVYQDEGPARLRSELVEDAAQDPEGAGTR